MKCSIDGCDKPIGPAGMCVMHYTRVNRYGDPHYRKKSWGDAKKFLEDTLLYEGDECIMWPFRRTELGYPWVQWKGKKTKAHRVVCFERYGPPPEGKNCAAHYCGNGHLGCITPNHLRWASLKENSADMIKHGTQVRGEKVHNSLLTEDKVRHIRTCGTDFSNKKLSEMYGVSSKYIQDVRAGRNWKWVK